MKKVLILLLATLSSTPLLAQEETLVGEKFHSGGYGGPVSKLGLVNGKIGVFSGGRGGWIINHKFVIGGGGYGLSMDVETDQFSVNGKQLYLDMSYGGFEMEYIHNSDQVVHWTIHALLGSGTVKLREHDPNEVIESDRIYVVEPSFNVNFNITTWFRLGLGASYMLALGAELGEITSSDISGPSCLIIFKFGSF